jgi:hypothetical protein
MRCHVNSLPVFFAQALEIEDRQRLRSFEGITKEMGNLLRNRSMLALCPSLKLLIKRVGKVLDV